MIVFESVTKVYEPDVAALNDVSFVIEKGEFVFIVGASGSGKSTLVKLLLKEIDPTEGRIVVGGRDLTRLKHSKVPLLRRNVGCVFQDFKLLPSRTAAENVAYALKVQGESRTSIRRKVPEVLNMVGLAHKMNSLPDELSGGEQQRVSIARAVVNHPPLLVCDEPTGNLDPDTSVGIMQLLYRINRAGTTILMVTHDREMVDKMRKRVIALEDGRLARDERRGGYAIRMSAHALLFSEAWSSISREHLDDVRRDDDRADRHVPARPVHRARHVGALVERPREEGAARQGLLRGRRDAARRRTRSGQQLGKDPAREDRRVRLEGEGAKQIMAKKFPTLYKTPLPSNPLPDSWVVTPTKGEDTPTLGAEILAGAVSGRRTTCAGASKTAKRVLTIAEVIWIVFLVAVVLLVTASTLLIANTIRLSIFARRREIEVMKLVGATNWFVRGPFMLEGLICGLGGSILAVVLLVLGKEVALPAILPHIGGGSDVHALPFALNALALIGAGLLLGAAGSGLTLRRFLQV